LFCFTDRAVSLMLFNPRSMYLALHLFVISFAYTKLSKFHSHTPAESSTTLKRCDQPNTNPWRLMGVSHKPISPSNFGVDRVKSVRIPGSLRLTHSIPCGISMFDVDGIQLLAPATNLQTGESLSISFSTTLLVEIPQFSSINSEDLFQPVLSPVKHNLREFVSPLSTCASSPTIRNSTLRRLALKSFNQPPQNQKRSRVYILHVTDHLTHPLQTSILQPAGD
jgi:hypothetical protein